MSFGRSKAKLVNKDTPEDHLRRRRGRGRGDRGARGDQGLPRQPGQVPGDRRQDPQGRAALRPARHRQDAARPRGGWRGRRALLLDLRLGLRRDVRRRRRVPRARPVRAGQGQRPGDHLRRRDRRRRPAPRRGTRRRSRRARADAEPAARRDGRLRRQGRRDPDRGHQPSRTSSTRRCCVPAASTGRSRSAPPDVIGREAILRVHAKGKPFAADVDLDVIARRTPGFTGADLANVINEAALLTARNNGRLITTARARGVDRPRHRRPGAQDARDERQGEAGHRLSRGRPRAHRVGDAQPRPGAQGDDPAARPLARAHPRAAARGPLHADPRRDPRPARVRTRRACCRGAGLPRADHRRVRRHREGHQAGPRDGHRVRHEHEARRGQVRHRRRRAVHGPRLRPPARLLRGHRRRHRLRGARPDRGRARRGVGDPQSSTATCSTRWCSSWSRRRRSPRTISSASSRRCASARRTTRSARSASARPSDRPPVDIPPSLRKPATQRQPALGSANGSANGGSGDRDAGLALPGVVPEPTGAQPSIPGPGATFGPQDGSVGQPYGGYPPAPSDTPSGGGQGQA